MVTLYVYVHTNTLYQSEGVPERDIESLGVMGWGLAAAENSSAVVAAAVAAAVVAPWGRGGGGGCPGPWAQAWTQGAQGLGPGAWPPCGHVFSRERYRNHKQYIIQ